MKKFSLLWIACLSALLSGCYSNAQIANANKIVTALPEEVKGCEFIRDIDTPSAYASIGQARFALKYKAFDDKATHIVETHAWPGLISPRFIGVGLSAREYRCAEGKGPKTAKPGAEITYEIPSYDMLFPDDEIFDDFAFSPRPFKRL